MIIMATMWKVVLLFVVQCLVFCSGQEEDVSDAENLGTTIEYKGNTWVGCTLAETCIKICPLGYIEDASGQCECNCKKQGNFTDILIEDDNQFKTLMYEFVGDLEEATPRRSKRSATIVGFGQWPQNPVTRNVEIPYSFANDISQDIQNTVRSAIGDFDRNTCIRFVPIAGTPSEYVHIVTRRTPQTCSAGIGMSSNRPTTVRLGTGCGRVTGIVVHELMHTLGFWHEQARPDRDNFVRINYNNIARHNHRSFNIMVRDWWDSYGTSYDFQSIMQSDGFIKALNPNIPTITRIDNNLPVEAQRDELSATDIIQINAKYCGGARGQAGNAGQQAPPPVVPQNPAPRPRPVVPQNPAPRPRPGVPQNPAPRLRPVVPQNPAPRPWPVVPQNPAPRLRPVVPQNPAPRLRPVVPQNPAPRFRPVVPQNPPRRIRPVVVPAQRIRPVVVPAQRIRPVVVPAQRIRPVVVPARRIPLVNQNRPRFPPRLVSVESSTRNGITTTIRRYSDGRRVTTRTMAPRQRWVPASE